MPTYEYECVRSGRRFERLQSMEAAPLKTCPECGGEARRLITGGAGLIFKGRGFYATDSRRAARTANREGGRTCCGRQTRCDTPPCRQ